MPANFSAQRVTEPISPHLEPPIHSQPHFTSPHLTSTPRNTTYATRRWLICAPPLADPWTRPLDVRDHGQCEPTKSAGQRVRSPPDPNRKSPGAETNLDTALILCHLPRGKDHGTAARDQGVLGLRAAGPGCRGVQRQLHCGVHLQLPGDNPAVRASV